MYILLCILYIDFVYDLYNNIIEVLSTLGKCPDSEIVVVKGAYLGLYSSIELVKGDDAH